MAPPRRHTTSLNPPPFPSKDFQKLLLLHKLPPYASGGRGERGEVLELRVLLLPPPPPPPPPTQGTLPSSLLPSSHDISPCHSQREEKEWGERGGEGGHVVSGKKVYFPSSSVLSPSSLPHSCFCFLSSPFSHPLCLSFPSSSPIQRV